MRIIALDICDKYIGVAVVETSVKAATLAFPYRLPRPVGTIAVNGLELQRIVNVMTILKTNLVIVGLPGGDNRRSGYVREFADILGVYGAKVIFQDEFSLMSILAKKSLKRGDAPYSKDDVSREVACLILQDFIDSVGRSVIKAKPQPVIEAKPESLMIEEKSPAGPPPKVCSGPIPPIPLADTGMRRIDIVNRF